ncbi:MAG: hypothetical protein KDE56_12215, partial [Anaerolineales bacterium]|nr:hypothetical protein [Anaerolineales bacterium]
MNKIAVLGSGTMGRGIAQASVLAGYEVVLFDIEQGLLDKAIGEMFASIDQGVARGKTDGALAAWAKTAVFTTTSLATAAQADLVVEAAPEKLDLKRQIFAEL